jgi:hypothetical protein
LLNDLHTALTSLLGPDEAVMDVDQVLTSEAAAQLRLLRQRLADAARDAATEGRLPALDPDTPQLHPFLRAATAARHPQHGRAAAL